MKSVDGFLTREALIDWQPQTRAMQILQIRRNDCMLEKASTVLSEMQRYREFIGH